MSMISMLDYDLAIGYSKLFPKDLKNILKEKKIKLVEIPEDEFKKSKTLAVNVLTLSPRNIIMINGYSKTFDLLSKAGCKINLFSGDELCIKAEGGPTCLTRPILRD
jgi:N-dimethylarginine dimethylaminohydrolase